MVFIQKKRKHQNKAPNDKKAANKISGENANDRGVKMNKPTQTNH